MQIIFLSLLAATPQCDFETAFSKGTNDLKVEAYGANLDQYCAGASADDRRAFTRAYILGRENSVRLQEAKIAKVPSSEEDLQKLLAEAQQAMEAKVLKEKLEKQESEIRRLKDTVQKLENSPDQNASSKN